MTHTMISLTVFLLASSTFAGVLLDNFEDGSLYGWRRFEGKIGPHDSTDNTIDWRIDKGELVVQSEEKCQSVSVFGLGDRTWENYEFEAQFQVEPFVVHPKCNLSPFLGVGVRYNDRNGVVSGAALVGRLDGEKWRVDGCQLFFERGVKITVRQGDVPIEVGKWHTAQFIARGDQYTAFIDGQLVCRFTSAVLEKSGGVVFLARNGRFRFDNIDVTGDGIPAANKTAFAVSPQAKLAVTWAKVKRFQ